MASCPECKRELPWGNAFKPGGGFGLPDKRNLECPYCGAPLEPVRWTDYVVLVVVLAVLLAARKVLGPLVDGELLAVGVVVVAAYHLLKLLRRRVNGDR